MATDAVVWRKALCGPVFQKYLGQNLIISVPKKYGKVIHLFPKGLYSFCGIWSVFVSLQFQTRYSGHTLSRLAEIRHNKTKQSTFPTTRGKSPKTTVTLKVILVYFVPLQVLLVKQFVITSCNIGLRANDKDGWKGKWCLSNKRAYLGFPAKVEISLSMPLLKERRVGWLVLCQINGAFPSRRILIWNRLFLEPGCDWKSQVHLICVLARSAGGKCGLLADGQTFSAIKCTWESTMI